MQKYQTSSRESTVSPVNLGSLHVNLICAGKHPLYISGRNTLYNLHLINSFSLLLRPCFRNFEIWDLGLNKGGLDNCIIE